MALYIEFTRKCEDTPTPLNVIDEELCSLLNESVNLSNYVHYWPTMIGQQVCIEGYELGTKALREKVISYDVPKLVTIHDYLVENFTAKTWSK